MLAAARIFLSGPQLEQLWTYHRLLRKNNEDRDLTRIVGFENIVQKHYVDCLLAGGFGPLPSPILDIGTGAGFPGIPLKIRYPKVRFILAEHRPRRVAFLEEVRRSLGLEALDIFPHQVTSKTFATPVNGVITRALETIEKTLLRTSACAGIGTTFHFLKGPAVDEELASALKRFKGRFEVQADHHYFLPGTNHERRFVVLKKLVPATAPAKEVMREEDLAEGGDQNI